MGKKESQCDIQCLQRFFGARIHAVKHIFDSSVQLLSHVLFFMTPWTVTHQVSLSIANSWGLTQTHVHRTSDVIQPSHILCHPLLLLPSIFPSIRIFSNESVLHIRWPNYWSFSFSISPSNEYGWIIYFHGLAVHNSVFTEAEYLPKARTGIPGTHISWSTLTLCLSKCSLEFFHKLLWRNSNQLFGQSNITTYNYGTQMPSC